MMKGIKCESIGDKVVIEGALFSYCRLGNMVSLELSDELSIEEVYIIKEVIQLYEELIELN